MERICGDVVVLGSGGAGMAAAITAAEGGAKVIVLEKRPFPGGASNTPVALGYVRKDQAFRDKAFKVHMEMTHWTANADLVRGWIDASGEVPEWMKNMGVPMTIPPPHLSLEKMGQPGEMGGFPPGHNIGEICILHPRGKGHGGAQMIRAMVAKAGEMGVELRYTTPGKKILKAGGRITGVYAEDKSGRPMHIDAAAVIVATAGFNEDPEMVKKYSNYGYTLDRYGNCEEGDLFFLCPFMGLTGDGIKMAWEVGADRGAMGISGWPHVPGPGVLGNVPWTMFSQLRIIQEQPYLWVNQQGQRFMDEEIIHDRFPAGERIARQPEKCMTLIFDDDTRRKMEEEGVDFIYFIFPATKLNDIEGDMRKVISKGNKHAFFADTIEELAEQAGIDPAVLKKTVDEYNSYCDKGHDDQYAKNPKYLRPVRQGKFYGVKVFNAAYQTIGGIKVNGNTEAMTKEGKVISGLYAAGDIIAAELYGDPPILGNGTIGFAVTSGRMAGKSALEYINNYKSKYGI